MQRIFWSLATSTLAAALVAVGCQGSSPEQSSIAPGTLLQDPANTDGFSFFLADSHFNGNANQLMIESVRWGRLVDVLAQHPTTGERQKIMRDLLVDPKINSDGTNYLLQQNQVTQREELIILHAFATPGFDAAFQPLKDEVGLEDFIEKGISANELPPFTAVPRNAAVLVQFNDLLDPATILKETVQLRTGHPPTAPFEARIVPDRCHGGLVNGVMHSSRVLVDMTVSKDEAQTLGLQVNSSGLPGATSVLLPNVVLRIPTKINTSAAQFSILANLSGHSLSFSGNGPADASSPTLDVLRGFRSGGTKLATNDDFNGYLEDHNPPEVLGAQQVTIDAVVPVGAGQHLVSMTFHTPVCAVQPRPGDLLEVSNGVVRILTPGGPLTGASVVDMLVERVDESFAPSVPPALGLAEYRTPWSSDPLLAFLPACFVRFNPQPGTQPAADVSPSATIRVAFSEPMDPDRVDAFDGIRVTDPTVVVTKPLSFTAVGPMAASEDLTAHTFVPSSPFKHTNLLSETFQIEVISFEDLSTGRIFGVTDLAGNVLSDLLPMVPFTLDSTAPTLLTGNIALRFTTLDEDGNTNPEVRGQVVPDLSRGVMQARAVEHFSGFADTTLESAPLVRNMTPILGGVVEPLSIYGSRTMTVWRYHDMGLPFYDDPFFNLDVEGLAWMVAGNGVQLDHFPEFQLSLAHSLRLPDELLTPPPPPLLPVYPQSGVVVAFAGNLSDEVGEPLFPIAPKTEGYLIQPLDAFLTPSQTLMAPFPVNLNKPVSEYEFWTWRDTAKLQVGGPAGGGVPLRGEVGAMGPTFYTVNNVPTIGLPLLMDFRTYPAPTLAQGLNRLGLAGVNAANGNLPFFRLHSTGGIKADQSQQLINPDQQTTAIGGLDFAGNPTPPVDSGFYYGNADFVTRVNRMHTVWFDAALPGNIAPSSYGDLVTIPAADDVPAGLQLIYAFRGATLVSPIGPASDAENIDPYGNPRPFGTSYGVTFLNGDNTWKENLSDLNGARFIQVRVTMISNVETTAVPELSAMGFSFSQ
jgi:hypothetical protein